MAISYDNRYFEKVIKCESVLLTDDIQGRYLLKIKLKNNLPDTLTVAMMNPSKADEDFSDDTVNKVIEFIYKKNAYRTSPIRNIGYINIVNIFPAYEPNSGKVQDKLKTIISEGKLDLMQQHNKKAFEDAFSESKKVILAWGDVPSKVKAKIHNHEALMTYDLIVQYNLRNKTYLFKYEEYSQVLTNKKRPRHPSWNTPERYVQVKDMKVSRRFLYIDI